MFLITGNLFEDAKVVIRRP